MQKWPVKCTMFPSAPIVLTMEQLEAENIGPVMKRYLAQLVLRLRDNPKGRCDSIGLYLLMMDVLSIFHTREEADAVRNAFPAFVDRIVQNTSVPEEHLLATKFVEEFHIFARSCKQGFRAMHNNVH